MPTFIEMLGQQAGTQTTSGLIGAGMGLLMAGHNDRRQIKQQQKLQDMQIAGNKQLTDYNAMKQLQMWKDTNYGPQMEELKKAGLNPGLIYGMSGGGGQSSSVNPGNVAGADAPKGGGEIQGMVGMGIQTAAQLQLLRAQRENIEADTANKQAENPNIPKQGVKLDKEITTMQLNIDYLKGTLNDRIDQINTQALHAITKSDRETEGLHLDRATRLQKAEIILKEAVQAHLKNLLIEAQTKQTGQATQESIQRVEQSKAEINKWATEIQQKWKGLQIQEKEMLIKGFEADLKAKYPGLWNVIGGQVNNVVAGLDQLLTGETPAKAPK